MGVSNLLAVALGGALGAVCRYGVGALAAAWWGDRFAYGTLAVNLAGCFAIGLLTSARLEWLAHPGVTAGFLGGLTTFSAFGLQTALHVDQDQHPLAAMNIAANVGLGIAAVMLGIALGRRMDGP